MCGVQRVAGRRRVVCAAGRGAAVWCVCVWCYAAGCLVCGAPPVWGPVCGVVCAAVWCGVCEPFEGGGGPAVFDPVFTGLKNISQIFFSAPFKGFEGVW